ncbi:hypothetical protein [Pseudomonas sp. Pseusp97]|uniref:hypothetical protein n=1 Tax=Pseudomonas sp. Pseusp97 TaxID=3243065 RepID=UPI0039A55EB4
MTVTKPSTPFYTNDIAPERLHKLNTPYFAEEQIQTFAPEAAAIIRQNQAARLANPAIGIRLFATEGSQTKRGGVIQKGTSPLVIVIESGEKLTVARTGDPIQYPDGSLAYIKTGAGKANGNLALVGSRLDNGDEIINTRQRTGSICIRRDTPVASDFLPALEDEE